MKGCIRRNSASDTHNINGAFARCGRVAMFVFAGLSASLSLAAVPVVESRSSDETPGIAAGNPVPSPSTQPSSTAGAPVGADQGSRLTTLYYQIQLMQEELRQLRGQLEEQQFVIDRLRRDQREQYLDLDGRVASLASNAVSTAAVNQAPAASNQAPAATSPKESAAANNEQPGASESQPAANPIQSTTRPVTASRPASSSASAAEQQSYNAAIALMRDKRFDESVDAFNQLVVDHPNGALTPNAFYWLGELYLAKNELEQSRQSFTQVMNLYPDHRKVPDAIYKLGVVFSLLGDSRRSLELLKRVQTDYPGSSAAGLADSYAAELQ